MPEGITITLPWPSVDGSAKPVPYLRVGDRVNLRHVVRHDWFVWAKVTRVSGIAYGPGRSVEVVPEEPITSPANWEVLG